VRAHPFATIGAAMVQGGGLGLYGDYLFGQADRFGGGLLGSAAGPLASEANNLYDLFQKARTWDPKTGTWGASKADFLHLALNNTPYINLHILRPALDLAILNRLQEWASPGTFARREAKMQKQFGQHFLVPPLAHGTRP
jgi:hypothetical protein